MDVFQQDSEFTQGNHPTNSGQAPSPPNAHDPPPLSHSHSAAFSTSEMTDSGAPTPEKDTSLRGKALNLGLSAEEKKERQKQQNRRAAERSRNKKREEVTALEMTVSNIQDENHRLRARLSSILASKPDISPSIAGDTSANDAPMLNVDYNGLAQLQAELTACKALLLEREIDWSRLNSASVHGEDDASARQSSLSRANSLETAQLEVRALQMAINELRNEYEALNRQRDATMRELDARRTLRDAIGDDTQPISFISANGLERTLLDLRGVLDGVIKAWEQSSTLPAQPNGLLPDERT